jgi:uncharacterized protein (UPF0332 family)
LNLSDALLAHAERLTGASGPGTVLEQVDLRRAVSAAYYSLFHRINGDAVALLAPNVSPATNYRIQRWLDHQHIKRICGRFASAKLDQPLLGLIGTSSPKDLQTVAQAFNELQEARLRADYDMGSHLDLEEALSLIDRAGDAIGAWNRIKSSPEANIFILSLFLWKNWDDRTR